MLRCPREAETPACQNRGKRHNGGQRAARSERETGRLDAKGRDKLSTNGVGKRRGHPARWAGITQQRDRGARRQTTEYLAMRPHTARIGLEKSGYSQNAGGRQEHQRRDRSYRSVACETFPAPR